MASFISESALTDAFIPKRLKQEQWGLGPYFFSLWTLKQRCAGLWSSVFWYANLFLLLCGLCMICLMNAKNYWIRLWFMCDLYETNIIMTTIKLYYKTFFTKWTTLLLFHPIYGTGGCNSDGFVSECCIMKENVFFLVSLSLSHAPTATAWAWKPGRLFLH